MGKCGKTAILCSITKSEYENWAIFSFCDDLMSEKEDTRSEMNATMKFWFADTENLDASVPMLYHVEKQ